MDIDPSEIGQRARLIRRRRGLSLDVAAGLAGISKSYLSRLESGQRRFERRGLLEDLAGALGCSVVDLTGQPYLPADRSSADTLACLPGIREAIYDATLDDAPDGPARPVAELARWAQQADAHRDQNCYALAGRELGTLLSELHTRAAAGTPDDCRVALAALVQACHVAAGLAEAVGYHDLALAAATREHEAAVRLGDPVALGLARYGWAQTWSRAGARRQAESAIKLALVDLEPIADPSAVDTGAAEMLGMSHLYAAKLAARSGRAASAHDHLTEARVLAERTGERNTGMQHFGPTNVALWTVSVGADLGEGPVVYEQHPPEQVDVAALNSRVRSGCYHLDLARTLAQDDGPRDAEALRQLDTADRAAPVLVRNNPIARELFTTLHRRAKRTMWELDSLRNRFGVG